ncbi:MAG: AbrB/MazE/SpoVT family DNA-binding domain-containing protein [Nitrospirota bacterium]
MTTATVTAKITDGGRIVIPAPCREALDLRTGDEVLLKLMDGELRLYSRKQAVRRAQTWAQNLNPKGQSMVDELLRDRQEDAAKE